MQDVNKEEQTATNGAAGKAERDTLTIEETAKRLGIGLNSAYAGVKAGTIPSLRIGKRILVPRAALETLLATGAPVDSSPASPRMIGPGHGAWSQYAERAERLTPVEGARVEAAASREGADRGGEHVRSDGDAGHGHSHGHERVNGAEQVHAARAIESAAPASPASAGESRDCGAVESGDREIESR